jgi:hypothetical protein
MADMRDHHMDPYVLTLAEVARIAASCKMLPGDWNVDPTMDHRRTGAPRVWIRPAASNKAVRLSFGISKEDDVFHVAIQSHANREDLPTEGSPFGTLDAALTMCRESLTVVLKRMWTYAFEKGIQRAGVCAGTD